MNYKIGSGSGEILNFLYSPWWISTKHDFLPLHFFCHAFSSSFSVILFVKCFFSSLFVSISHRSGQLTGLSLSSKVSLLWWNCGCFRPCFIARMWKYLRRILYIKSTLIFYFSRRKGRGAIAPGNSYPNSGSDKVPKEPYFKSMQKISNYKWSYIRNCNSHIFLKGYGCLFQ